MRLFRETSPAALPVSLAEAKAHLRVDHNTDDVLISSYIAAATEALDGRDGLLGRALVTQRWRLVLDAFPAGPIVLPLPPLRSVVALTYNPLDGSSAVTMSPSAYSVAGIGDADKATISPAAGLRWPSTSASPGAVSVSFEAGYGDADDVPAPIRAAILQHVGTLYESRESVLVSQFGAKGASVLPHAYSDLIAPYRLYSFG